MYIFTIFFVLFKAFTTIVSNALQIAVINGFGDFVLFLGKCFVTATTASVALLFMRQDPELHFYAIPVLVVCVFSFFIAHCIISLYEVSCFPHIMCGHFQRRRFYFCSTPTTSHFRPLSIHCSCAYARIKI